MLPACQAVLNLNGMSITGNARHQLQRAYIEPRYIGYLQQKYQWQDQIISSISWKYLSLAIRRINREVLIVKICSDVLSTAVTLKKRKYQAHDCCVLCQQRETRDLIIQCEAKSRSKWRRKMMTNLRSKLDKLNTKVQVKETFCLCLDKWFGGGNVDAGDYPETYQYAINSQIRIGWKHIFNGKLSVEWLKLQGDTKTEMVKYEQIISWQQLLLKQHSIT